jgi:hypothetical protein
VFLGVARIVARGRLTSAGLGFCRSAGAVFEHWRGAVYVHQLGTGFFGGVTRGRISVPVRDWVFVDSGAAPGLGGGACMGGYPCPS